MDVDELLYDLPLVGSLVRRMYRYFKNHTAVTNVAHMFVGLGIGLMIAGEAWFMWGFAAIILGSLFHIFALIHG